jgi:hypothetical protein
MPEPEVNPMYEKYLTHTYELVQNIVCTFCNCISHGIEEFEAVLPSYDALSHLRMPQYANIPFNFSCGIDVLDISRVLRQTWNYARQTYSFMSLMSQSPLQGSPTP